MADTPLATYLNDHLAGSVTVLELLSHLASAYAGTDVERFAKELHAEVAEDRRELEQLMAKLNIAQSAPRKASAWMAEKFAQVKLRVDDPGAGQFRLMESAEAISLGIEGKCSLWLALANVAKSAPDLRALDYDKLVRRAEDQRARTEAVRLEAAKAALGQRRQA